MRERDAAAKPNARALWFRAAKLVSPFSDGLSLEEKWMRVLKLDHSTRGYGRARDMPVSTRIE
jgi:hypothetical protein